MLCVNVQYAFTYTCVECKFTKTAFSEGMRVIVFLITVKNWQELKSIIEGILPYVRLRDIGLFLDGIFLMNLY